ncbi:peptidoglycan-binding domain-containing protein [Cryptosporangium arvum]|uniref:Putative peptidoglycan-binding domain-containing protein n=1 Tax=Cryptosporangium arvum DSM 44712 TaxID=927661 RepID=A0A010ZYM3_9ACTN|nr:peptidoglycan-binding domain-containing protein [Cryptosporangium arvum]EXG82287.1 putative peptidoglycan-binding domain-containing protein [Cryptosporangium arvum DSM 44712]
MAVAMGAAPSVARADDTNNRSFAGCPLLIERFSGDCVVKLQHYLNVVNPGYALAEDGKFGRLTRIAVLDFQGRNRLGADGNVGGITADALTAQYNAKQPPPPPANSPISCLAQGKVSDHKGNCVSDGVVGGGKPLGECLKEAAIDEATQKTLERAFTQGKFSSWKTALSTVKKISPFLTAAEAFKCGWWDRPGS